MINLIFSTRLFTMSIIFLWYLSIPVIRHYGELPEYKIFINYARPHRYTHKSLIIVGEFLACLKSMAKLLSTSAKTGFHPSVCPEGAIALTPTVSRCLCWQFQISFSLLSNILKMCFLLAHTDLSVQGGGCAQMRLHTAGMSSQLHCRLSLSVP